QHDAGHDNSTSAGLEYGICHLQVEHLIILAHSSCGGVDAAMHPEKIAGSVYLSGWLNQIDNNILAENVDQSAQNLLHRSHENCLTYPWVKERVDAGKLTIHRWFFDIGASRILAYSSETSSFVDLDAA
ncbi:MAG: carbonic anhydrase, partial [Pseudomonadota bacterium]